MSVPLRDPNPTKSNYPSNTIKQKKEERKKADKVVTGVVKTKKPTKIKRLREAFLLDDLRSVGDYVFFDVLVPAAKNMLLDTVIQGTERMMFGESRRTSKLSNPSYVSYNRFSQPQTPPTRRTIGPRQRRDTRSFDEFTLETKEEAESVIDGLTLLIDKYAFASIADLYDLLGMTSEYVEEKYGWISPRGMDTVRTRDGYMLVLPEARPLEEDR